MSGDDLRLFIETQRAGYRRELPQRIRAVEALCGRLLAGDASIEEVRLLEDSVHRLAGASGVFGLAAVGAAARSLELAIHCGDAGTIGSALESLKHQAPR